MSIVVKPPPPNVPIADAKGSVTLPWDLFFRALVERTGGIDAPTNTELSVALSDDAGIEEMKADLYLLRDEARLAPPVAPAVEANVIDNSALLNYLVAAIAEQRKEIDALKAGTIL
jgi:hypothetical protein